MSYTYNYSQPDEYHFSLDSIEAPKRISEIIQQLQPDQIKSSPVVVDLCSGCGVMGFELSYHCRELREFHFIEVQSEYQVHFDQNVKLISRSEVHYQLHLQNYQQLTLEPLRQKWKDFADLVICNPPYFFSQQGKLPPNLMRRRSRFFIDSDFENLIDAMALITKPQGRAFLLLRPLDDHSVSLEMKLRQELKKSWKGPFVLEKIADVRGTDLWMISS